VNGWVATHLEAGLDALVEAGVLALLEAGVDALIEASILALVKALVDALVEPGLLALLWGNKQGSTRVHASRQLWLQ
jgi:hypothetical protein